MVDNNDTKIIIAKDEGYMQITVDGHHKDPIVCAGISAIMQTAELGLKAIHESYDGVRLVSYDEYFKD